MKAVLLAAGDGARVRPLTLVTPKPLVDVGGDCNLGRNLDVLRTAGVTGFVVNLHAWPEQVVALTCQRAGDVPVAFSYEPALLGTAGALGPIASLLRSERFLVLYADNFIRVDYGALLDFHERSKADLTIVSYDELVDPQLGGVMTVGVDGRVERYVEKPARPAGRTSDAGVYVMSPCALDTAVRDGVRMVSSDLVPLLLKRRRPVYAFHSANHMISIDTPDRLSRARAFLARAAR